MIEMDRPENLTIADWGIPLLFETDVSRELKQFVLRDFDVLFANARDYELYDLNQIKRSEISNVEINGAVLRVEKRLYFLSSRLPDLLHENLGDVVIQDGTEKLLIPAVVLDAYKNALNLTKEYAFEFDALNKFVRMVTDATEYSPFTLHPKDVFYMPESPVLDRLEKEPHLVIEAQKFYSKTTQVRMPSVLEFKKVPLEQQKDGIYLSATGYSLEGEPAVPL